AHFAALELRPHRSLPPHHTPASHAVLKGKGRSSGLVALLSAALATVPPGGPALVHFGLEAGPGSFELCGGHMYRCTGQHAGYVPEAPAEVHPLLVHGELADALVVDRAAHLEHSNAA